MRFKRPYNLERDAQSAKPEHEDSSGHEADIARPLRLQEARGASSGPPRADAIRKILDYGFAAAPAERSAVSAAAAGFFAALASHNYATVCAGLGAGNRDQFRVFSN